MCLRRGAGKVLQGVVVGGVRGEVLDDEVCLVTVVVSGVQSIHKGKERERCGWQRCWSGVKGARRRCDGVRCR